LPSYVEWLTCLEMYRDVKNIETPPNDQVQTSGRGSPPVGGSPPLNGGPPASGRPRMGGRR
jgi:hypothetical protein